MAIGQHAPLFGRIRIDLVKRSLLVVLHAIFRPGNGQGGQNDYGENARGQNCEAMGDAALFHDICFTDLRGKKGRRYTASPLWRLWRSVVAGHAAHTGHAGHAT
ncbi:MAG: hypothetical protein KDJ89_15665, partial [Notoacmeibacter sp.]|nr:hypothetical protein [Notoacmeibacter sp.]